MALGPLMLDVQGTCLTPEEVALLKNPVVGGVILFARNFIDIEQLVALVTEIRAARGELLIAVDQEGGRVQRFREGFTRLPPMQQLGALLGVGDDASSIQFIEDCGWLMAAEVMACGVDFSFAPVLDVDDCGCEVIGDRAFSADPTRVVAAASAFMRGMRQAGMATTGKHFPGHGGVREDSHLETPFDRRSMDQIRQRDLLPFTRLTGQLDAVMPAHIVFPEVDSQPVGFSPIWLQGVLRGELGFDGVIFSDDLSMKGADVAGGYGDKARSALAAGCDMVLVCNNREGAMEVIDYLAAQPLRPNPRLPTMAMKNRVSSSRLYADPRWRQTRKKLHKEQF